MPVERETTRLRRPVETTTSSRVRALRNDNSTITTSAAHQTQCCPRDRQPRDKTSLCVLSHCKGSCRRGTEGVACECTLRLALPIRSIATLVHSSQASVEAADASVPVPTQGAAMERPEPLSVESLQQVPPELSPAPASAKTQWRNSPSCLLKLSTCWIGVAQSSPPSKTLLGPWKGLHLARAIGARTRDATVPRTPSRCIASQHSRLLTDHGTCVASSW